MTIQPTQQRRDVTTPDEQALINAHIARHGITQCPPQTYSRDLAEAGNWKDQQQTANNIIRRAKRIEATKAPVGLAHIIPLIKQGNSLPKIATILGISKSAISMRLQRANLTVKGIRAE